MNDQQYQEHGTELFREFAAELNQRTETMDGADSLRELALSFVQTGKTTADIYTEGPNLVSRLFTTYPDFAPGFPRELLWFLAGDCLHFMPDDEIELFQRMEEMRTDAGARGELFDFQAARAKLLKLQ